MAETIFLRKQEPSTRIQSGLAHEVAKIAAAQKPSRESFSVFAFLGSAFSFAYALKAAVFDPEPISLLP